MFNKIYLINFVFSFSSGGNYLGLTFKNYLSPALMSLHFYNFLENVISTCLCDLFLHNGMDKVCYFCIFL